MTIGTLKNNQSFNTSFTILDSKIENIQLKLPNIFFFQIITIQTLSESRT